MADTAVTTVADADSTSKARPEKPDETKYKADLEQAEKNHKAAQAKFVCRFSFSNTSLEADQVPEGCYTS